MIAVRSRRGSGRRRWAAGLVAAGAVVVAAGVALPLLPGAQRAAQAPAPAPSSSSATSAPHAPAADGDFWVPSRSHRGEVRAQPWSDDEPTAVPGRG